MATRKFFIKECDAILSDRMVMVGYYYPDRPRKILNGLNGGWMSRGFFVHITAGKISSFDICTQPVFHDEIGVLREISEDDYKKLKSLFSKFQRHFFYCMKTYFSSENGLAR